MTQLRSGIYLQPTKWLQLVGVTQDAEVFFNHHVPNVSPYEDTWDIREAYAELGSSTEGWFDLLAGRQIFSFGDERVIGPSDWSNQGRTFDTVRVDLHPTGVKVSIFASSVIVTKDGVVDHHLQGNNLYGIYSSFAEIGYPACDALEQLMCCGASPPVKIHLSEKREATGPSG